MSIYAPSSRESLSFKWRTVARIFAAWGVEPFPPTVEKIAFLGAGLKAGGYRSAPGYMSLYRTSAARAGFQAGPEQAVAYRDAARACTRGLGAPVKAMALPLLRLSELSGERSPWVSGGPCSPRNAVVVGSWWLLREIEVATLRARLVQRGRSGQGTQQVFLTLPASKADQEARGVERGHRCRCDVLPSRSGCPVCAVRDQLAFLRRQFPEAWDDDVPSWRLPLFPQLSGDACEKAAFVGTIVAAASQLGQPLASMDGSSRVSGHTLRVTGAQGLTRLGYPLWAVQLLGRWGSDTVKSYVGDAALQIFTEGSPTQPASIDESGLEALFHAAGRQPPATGRSTPRRMTSSMDPAAVERLVTQVAGDLHAELACALRAELRLEFARRSPRPRTTSDQASCTVVPLVRNDRTKNVHFIAIGPDSDLPASQWQSTCGWTFGRWGGFTLLGGAAAAPSCEHCISLRSKLPDAPAL